MDRNRVRLLPRYPSVEFIRLIDDKYRVSVPSRLRSIIAEREQMWLDMGVLSLEGRTIYLSDMPVGIALPKNLAATPEVNLIRYGKKYLLFGGIEANIYLDEHPRAVTLLTDIPDSQHRMSLGNDLALQEGWEKGSSLCYKGAVDRIIITYLPPDANRKV